MSGVVIETVLLVALTSWSPAQSTPLLPPPEKDPFVGSWQANAEKSRPKLDKANASYVCTIARDGDDRVISSHIDLRRRFTGGKVFENHNRIHCDGLAHRVQCGDLFCVESCMYKGTNVIQGETLLADGKMSYWMRVVSVDAQEMIALGYTDKSRTHVTSTFVLDRMK